MTRLIFGSKSEKDLYDKLISHWKKYVEVYPQIPVKNVISYQNL